MEAFKEKYILSRIIEKEQRTKEWVNKSKTKIENWKLKTKKPKQTIAFFHGWNMLMMFTISSQFCTRRSNINNNKTNQQKTKNKNKNKIK